MPRLPDRAGRGIDYHGMWIPLSFTRQPKTEFETDYMKELFDRGYGLARNGDPWAKEPRQLQLIDTRANG